MEIAAILSFGLLLFSSVCFIYAWYQLHQLQKRISSLINSLREKGV